MRLIFFEKLGSRYSDLIQVNLIGLPYGLSFQEIKDLWAQADINGDGVVHDEEFKVSSIAKLWFMLQVFDPFSWYPCPINYGISNLSSFEICRRDVIKSSVEDAYPKEGNRYGKKEKLRTQHNKLWDPFLVVFYFKDC